MKKIFLSHLAIAITLIVVICANTSLFSQTATEIELTGTTSNLEASYNVATVVDPNIVISSNGTINGFRVQISQSYTTGDVLGYTGTLPSGVTQAFNTTTGVLSFSGSATAQQWQDLLRTVRFTSTSSVCYPTARVITFTAGTVYYNPLTGHYYEYVTLSPANTWSNAKSAAAARSYFGRIGYLATFSSSAENNFVWKIMSNDGWFGASDDYNQINNALGTITYASQTASENKWSWVTGPEAGIQFSTGATAVTGRYSNWNGGEPNNSGGEHYGQFYSGSQGRWNDLSSTHTLGGYLCEYGGMPNDNTELTPYVSRNVTVLGSSTGTITGGGVNVCTGSNSTTLNITDFAGTVVRWESSLDNFFTTGTNISNTSTSYTVSNITQTTYYRAMVNSTSPNSCTNVYTSSVPVYVSPTLPGNITAVNNNICVGGDVELTLSGHQGNINKWQWSNNSGTTWNDVLNNTTFLTQTLSTAGTFLFRAEVQTPGCGAAVYTSNKSISVASGTPPDGGVVSTSSFCGGSNAGTLNLSGYTGTITTWQLSNDGGIVWSDVASSSGLTTLSFSSVSANRLYRVKVANGSCGNAYSEVGGVEISTSSVSGTVTGAQNICGGFAISSISLAGNNGNVQWQSSTNNSSFSNISGATSNPLAQSAFPALVTNTYIRAAVTNGACATAYSNAVLVTVEVPDTLYQDTDGDGFGNPLVDSASCVAISGYVSNANDCDDGTVYYQDLDADGFGSINPAGCNGLFTSNDCDDSNPSINVSGIEVCNLLDDDCDGSIDEGVMLSFYLDDDNDGYGDLSSTVLGCTAPLGYVSNDDDCNDSNSGVNPGAAEICNGLDEDCDLELDEGVLVTFYQDIDGDNYGNAAVSVQACSAPSGYVNNDLDFDDTESGSYPGAPESCNLIDDDGDGLIDEGVQNTYYADADGDSFGNADVSVLACAAPSGYITNSNDCDDSHSTVFPGSTEICNLVDEDCDGLVDEGVQTTYYLDGDGDGFGDLNITTEACTLPVGYASNYSDCDDLEASVFPGASEICNLVDEDCDDLIDEGVQITFYLDGDGDGFGDAQNIVLDCTEPSGYSSNDNDCDDTNPAVAPDQLESCNLIDDDCDGEVDEYVTTSYYSDNDGDGFGDLNVSVEACSQPLNFVLNSSDCDDSAVTYVDSDGDGYGSITISDCGVMNNTDCNDNDAILNFISAEVCNNFDDDCDGVTDNGLTFVDYYLDNDGDGYGAGAASNLCADPGAGFVTNSTDCNDSDATLNSISTEVCNNFDDDCDGSVDNGLTFIDYYVDADGDGYGAGAASNLCADPGAGFVTNNTDCNDNDAALNSISTEVCNNFDDDCDGEVDEFVTTTFYADNDGDGFGGVENTTQACEVPEGYVSNADDCDDAILTYEDLDGDGFGNSTLISCGVDNSTDCNDNDATLNSISAEVCNNFDDDCDGVTDNGLTFVDYYLDNDGDGYGAGEASNLCVDPGVGFVTNNTDCNDNDATLNSISTEVCNNFDDDCDGVTDNGLTFVDYYLDNDGDGYGAGAASNLCADPGAGFVTNNTDCNDNDATLNSITAEVCNSFDDDCDGVTDNGLTFVDYYLDNDGDGYGAGAASNLCADPGAGYVTNNTDCNDNDAALNSITAEVCNSFDDDCDGEVDEFVTTTFYADNDGDGFGGVENTTQACEVPEGYVANADDCDDAMLTYEDLDGDGYGSVTLVACGALNPNDCDDSSSESNPGATEICDNGIDDDCDGSETTCIYPGCTDTNACNYDIEANTEDGSCIYPTQSYLNCEGTCMNDIDADGVCDEIEIAGCTDVIACNYSEVATDDNGTCTYPAQNYLTCNGTCINDTDDDGVCDEIEIAGCTDALACNFDPSATDENGSCTYPSQAYLNCDGTCINDSDNDGVCNEIEVAGCTDVTACNYNLDATEEDGSCILPVEEICNLLDDDCDGEVDEFVTTTFYADLDGDGFGDANNTSEACDLPVGYVTNNNDCDDQALTYLDVDNDGFGSTTIVECGVYNNLDCNDGTSLIQPDATEICNEVDDDCDGAIDEGVQNTYYADADGDGFGDVNGALMACTLPQGFVTNADDCDDTQWTYLDVDQDGYGVGNPIECGAPNNLDCNDINSSMNPGVPEICNGIDDNCSGVIDEGLLTTYYIDVDEDTYGDPNNMIEACTQPAGFVINNDDCNDAANWANPAGVEVCNGIDDNCDGTVDEGVLLTYYGDLDGDGFGNINDSIWSCAQPDGYIDNTNDCDDSQPSVYLGATEVFDELDNDCNGLVDEGFEFIPDAFSPNMDGDYDLFVIDRLLPQEKVSIKVYNRWGGLMYESSEYQNDWNGTSNVGGHAGEEMAVGTYFYEIELNFSNKTYSGYITLWR